MARRVSQNYNTLVNRWLGVKVIAYNPYYAHITKSVTAAVFMDQLLFWWGKGRKLGWVYKSANEFYMETGLTPTNLETAIKKWKDLGVLETKNKGIPQTRHFKIYEQNLTNLLRRYSGVTGQSPFEDPYRDGELIEDKSVHNENGDFAKVEEAFSVEQLRESLISNSPL